MSENVSRIQHLLYKQIIEQKCDTPAKRLIIYNRLREKIRQQVNDTNVSSSNATLMLQKVESYIASTETAILEMQKHASLEHKVASQVDLNFVEAVSNSSQIAKTSYSKKTLVISSLAIALAGFAAYAILPQFIDSRSTNINDGRKADIDLGDGQQNLLEGIAETDFIISGRGVVEKNANKEIVFNSERLENDKKTKARPILLKLGKLLEERDKSELVFLFSADFQSNEQKAVKMTFGCMAQNIKICKPTSIEVGENPISASVILETAANSRRDAEFYIMLSTDVEGNSNIEQAYPSVKITKLTMQVVDLASR